MSIEPARLLVWEALSELFLDTELDDADIASIARRLQASGWGIAELERTYAEEVAPVCWRNLIAVPGGAWAGFDPQWLAQAIARQRENPDLFDRIGALRRLRAKRRTSLSRPDWERVKAILTP